MLKIADQQFSIEWCEFMAYLAIGVDGWAVTWNIEFRARRMEVNGVDWQPHLVSHAFTGALPELERLPGTRLQLPDCDEDGEPLFLLHVLEHEAVRNVSLAFGEWRDNKIGFTLSAVVDVRADDIYGENLPFTVSLVLPFDGVVVDEARADRAAEKFSRFFDLGNFSDAQQGHEGGGCLFRFHGF